METPVKERILQLCQALFLRQGIRSVTMNDIATQLGVSKKTIYQHFPDKPGLVHAVLERHIGEMTQVTLEIQAKAQNPLEELLGTFKHLNRLFAEMHPGVVIEIQKYYPDAYDLIERHKREFVFYHIYENLKRGFKLGLYRDDLDLEIMTRLYLEMADLMFRPEVFPEEIFPPSRLHRHMILHYLHGICSPSGLELLYDYKNTLDDTPIS